MPRRRRLEFKGANHLVRVSGRPELTIFFDPDQWQALLYPGNRTALRLRKFEAIVTAACEECGAKLLAYRIESNQCALLVHVAGASLDALMQRICGPYSRYLHAEMPLAKGHVPFSGRYASKIIAPQYLPHAVRRLHNLMPGTHALTSNVAYIGGRSRLLVDATEVRKLLIQKGFTGLAGYRAFSAQPENPFVSKLFERGSPLDSRIVGDRAFVIRAHAAAAQPPAPPSLEQLSRAVAGLLKLEVKDLHATTHVAVLGRSLVAWFALRTGAATLTQTGKWFSLSAATLGQGIRHYRQVSPQLFKMELLALGDFDPSGEDRSGGQPGAWLE